MPIYEYQCEACSHTFEAIQKMTDAPVATCVLCGGPVRRLLSAPGLVFKGTGWYVTDYPNAERKKAMEAEKKVSSDGDSTKSSPGESKPAAKEKE
ncbi:MAG: FmdB family zinc ribbon protein [Candidatus Methylomirabilales bacterium]